MKKINLLILLTVVLVVCTSFFLFTNTKIKIPNVISARSNKTVSEYSVRGIDVSHYQGKINWEKVSSENVKFVFIKSTQGSYYKDKTYRYNSSKAKENNLLVGPYHYYIAKDDPVLQFNNFVKNTPKNSFNLPPVIDIEYVSNAQLHQSKNHDEFLKNFKKFEMLVSEYYGTKPILYTSGDFYLKILKNNFTNKLWICDFGSKKIWYLGKDEFLFWQFSNRGKVNGIPTNVDLNVFNGDMEDLKKIISF
jgi:lysozyme